MTELLSNDNQTIAKGIDRAVIGAYPADRCKQLRRTCMMQARKRKDAGMGRAVVCEWLGYAYYWHLRATHPGLSVDQCAALVQQRAQKVNARISVPSPIAELADAPMHGAIAPVVDSLVKS